MKLARHGPEYKPVCREEKIKEWTEVIRVAVRYRNGGDVIANGEATSYAEQYWQSLTNLNVPVKDIAATPGILAAEWTLATHTNLIATADVVVKTKKPKG